MYNLRFIFEECGFGWVPAEVRRELLYNVSFDLGHGQIKLYVLDESRRFLSKISADGKITRQYEARAAQADGEKLSRFLGATFDFQDLLLDTIEGDDFYLLIEQASASEYIHFLTHLCHKYGVKGAQFVEAVNRINQKKVGNVFECCLSRAVSGVRVGISDGGCKIYARPFRTGNGFELGVKAREFLMRLYDCDEAGLELPLQQLWVATDLLGERVVIVTQEDDLL